MSAKLLQVENLTLGTSGGTIVHNLSFSIAQGEIVALTGKSGSGKTSIAMALLDLLPPAITVLEGLINWTGKDQKEVNLPSDQITWPSLRGKHMGFTQQDVFSTFDPVLPMGKQMIMIISERTGQSETNIEKELILKLEEVGLHAIDRLLVSYPHQLSGGQLQRCQIALAIVMKPELLIADEPTSAIDKINQLELLEVFAMLRSRYNMAILCITHEEEVVRKLADREIQLAPFLQSVLVNTISKQEVRASDIEPTVVLEVKDLEYHHYYGGLTYQAGARVGKLDFVLEKGTCLGVVGESGSGKSTLAQLLVGLYVPSKGSLILNDRQIDFQKSIDVQFLRSKVQLVMQDGRGALHPYFTVRTILSEVVDLQKSKRQSPPSNLKEVLSQVGLPESLLDRRASQLSGGECLRVSLARALLVQPDILICDESTSALDGQTRNGIIDLLKELMKERALSMLFISHDELIIRSLSSQIAVMAEGKMVEQGPAEEIIKHPTHAITKKIFSADATLHQSGRL